MITLSEEIKKAYTKLLKAIEKAPNQSPNIADIIAYQIGWGKCLIRWYEEENPEMPGEGFTKWDYKGLAHHFHKKYHYDGAEQQLKEFANVVKKIITISEKEHQTGNLYKLDIWPWCTLPSGKQWPLEKWIRVNTVAPYRRAVQAVKKYFNIGYIKKNIV